MVQKSADRMHTEDIKRRAISDKCVNAKTGKFQALKA